MPPRFPRPLTPYRTLREIADHVWLISFMHYDLGFFDHESGRVECAPNPFEAKVLPMSSV
jgi:putative transposase